MKQRLQFSSKSGGFLDITKAGGKLNTTFKGKIIPCKIVFCHNRNILFSQLV